MITFIFRPKDDERVQLHVFKLFTFQYVVERHGQTLLPHFLGMYRITVNDNETYLVVMKNIFSPRLTIHKKYDLKVSSKHRFMHIQWIVKHVR